MLYHYLAGFIVVLHGLFVLFVVLGGLLVLWRVKVACFHVPAVLWAASIEFFGWICPLTPLENMFRRKGGMAGYGGGFVEHYLMPVLYPESLTREMQVGIGLIVLIINIVLYGLILHKMRKTGKKSEK